MMGKPSTNLAIGALFLVALVLVAPWGVLWPTPAMAQEPGTAFQDCDACPRMVVVPPGGFMMGSPSNEKGRYDDEGPQHRVTISYPLAVGKYEVTFEEWDACVADGGCDGYRPDDQGWGRGRLPVVNVSWRDAQAYVAWLSGKTGQTYRLLSEAEWEYVARAGTTSTWPCGGSAPCLDGASWYVTNSGGRTHPVGEKAANSHGLHDMSGNVWEWVEDCLQRNYDGAPGDGSAWTTGVACSNRVLRGGSWGNNSRYLRSAYHDKTFSGDSVGYDVGFRVARTLSP